MVATSNSKAASRDRAARHRKKRSNPKGGTYFQSLTVENVRCFGPQQFLSLASNTGALAQWTVILGDNGVGKTTILECFAIMQPSGGPETDQHPMIGPRLTRASPWFFQWHIQRNNVRQSAKVTVEIALSATLGKESDNENIVPFEISKSDPAGSMIFWNTNDDMRLLDLGCFAFGAGRRMRTSSFADSDRADPMESLFSEEAPLRNAEEWLLKSDYTASKASRVQEQARERLQSVKKVLIDLLPDVDDIRFTEPNKPRETPGVEFLTPYGWVSIHSLGLGYRTLIAWMVDFASRLFERDPNSSNPLAQPAVCLVDEIDLHLHPRWQRKIMHHLSTHFPKTQFIVTAHSPLFVQAAAGANIAVLRREGDHVVIDQSYEAIQGWRVDQVLTSDLFGLETARPPEYEDLIKQRKEILTKARLTASDKRKLKDLEAKLGDLPAGETKADMDAMDIIRKAAERLKQAGE